MLDQNSPAFLALLFWTFGYKQEAREKLSFFCQINALDFWALPLPPGDTARWSPDKKALIPCRACACADLGQCAQDHYDSGVLAELLMRETIKKWAKANFPLFCNTYTLSYDWSKA